MSRPDFPAVIDSTMRGCFVSCPKKFDWEFQHGLAPVEVSIHLHFGGCLAKGCEVFRRAFYTGTSYEDALALGTEAILLEWGDYDAEGNGTKSLESCLVAFREYFKAYHPDGDYLRPFLTGDGQPAVEFTFALPIDVDHPVTGDPIIYAGRFDMLGIYNDQLFVVDEKTTTGLGGYWSAQWDLRGQFTGYVWASQQFGYPVVGAIVRGIAIQKTDIKFGEAITYRPTHLVDAWYKQLCRDVERMKDCWAAQYWDVNFDSTCASYGGCQYVKLCLSPVPEKWVDVHFTRRYWDPLAADPSAPPNVKAAV